MTRRTRMTASGRLTSRRGRDGPSSMRQNETNGLAFLAWSMRKVTPSEFTHTAHYDQRPLQCVRCSYVPKSRVHLNDTPEGYVCRAVGACEKRAKESYD